MNHARFKHIANPFVAAALALGLMLIVASCTPKNEKVNSSDELVRANYLIEQGQSSEAIYILVERVRRDPKSAKARVLLASAYAARAGLQLSKFKNFAAEVVKWDKPDEIWPDDSEDFFTEVAKAAWRINVVVKAFDAIPAPTNPSAHDDLVAALDVLDNGGALVGGPSLYRALLRTALFKEGLSAVDSLKNVRGCQVEVPELIRWLRALQADLEKILEDVAGGLGDPEAKARLLDISTTLHRDVGGLLSGDGSQRAKEWIQIPSALRRVTGVCK